jgi:hypothetical protein
MKIFAVKSKVADTIFEDVVTEESKKYLKYRKHCIKDIFKTCEVFKYKTLTAHMAVAIFDRIMEFPGKNRIQWLRDTYSSCKDVISEQICVFMASVSL